MTVSDDVGSASVVAIHQAPGLPGLYDVTMGDGSMREDVTLGEVAMMLQVVAGSFVPAGQISNGGWTQPPVSPWAPGTSVVGGCPHGVPFSLRCWTCNPFTAADIGQPQTVAVTVAAAGSDEMLAALGRIEALLQRLVDRQNSPPPPSTAAPSPPRPVPDLD